MSFLRRGSGIGCLMMVCCCLFAGCGNPFSALHRAVGAESQSSVELKPNFVRALYRCTVDGRFLVKKFHLSGILLIKQFDDSSTRVVFQNEMGFPFFDFEWNAADSFRVVSVNEKMDRSALIRTLRKDFELVLMKGLHPLAEYELTTDSGSLNSATQGGIRRLELQKGIADYYYYFFFRQISWDDSPKVAVTPVVFRIENFGRKKVVSVDRDPQNDWTWNDIRLAKEKGWIVASEKTEMVRDGLPAKMTITHHRAHFTIQLDRLPNTSNQPEDEQQPD